MAHHGLNMNEEMRQEALKKMFGETKRFPDGKIDRFDEGEIKFGIAADHNSDNVVINFGKKVSWIGFTADQAIDIAHCLIKKSMELKTKVEQ